ncbi:MAG: hypothetical protein LBD34_02325 [Puniceicoccales bacterium]|jgi:hypothetical protein|nr:hypothetical protein [Puniceicoccales bacterium]
MAEVFSDVAERINLTQRGVAVFRPNKRKNVEEAQKYKKTKERLNQLEAASMGTFLLLDKNPDAVRQFIQQADDDVKDVNYKEKVAELNGILVKNKMGKQRKAITDPSVDPEVITQLRKKFGKNLE